ncbi:MAG: putative lipid II flippase FtsW [Clostridiales Family XIII bacterium]|jgi:cell division protein FtsW|nr:putative lipid II flippase FtsW [Clostridiales Family XIII bacterium]
MTKARGKIDALILLMVVILVIFGVVMVFSASFYSTISANEGPYYYLSLAVRYAVVGFILMIIASFVPYRIYMKFAPAIVALSLFLLLILYTPLGHEAGGATRWIKIGSLTFMPGEWAKFAVIVGVAWYYTKYADRAKSFLHGFLPVAVGAAVYFYLIEEEPNLSTALIIVLTALVMMFIAGVRIAYLAGIAALGFAGIFYMIQSAQGEHLTRITNFWDPFSDAQGDFYQTVQGLLALGSGGLTGVGLGNSVEKALWLPEAQNDFIFAIIGEETGFIGCILVLVAYIILIWRCMLIAMRSKDRFAVLTGGGISILFALQVILNIGVVTASLPPTGVILPFISYGGNAIILFMFLMGIMLNISRGDASEAPGRRSRPRQESAG